MLKIFLIVLSLLFIKTPETNKKATMPVPEAEIIRAFTNMYNKLKTNKKVIITPIINQLVTLKNRISAQSLEYAEIDRQIMLINDQLALIADLKQKQMIDEETYLNRTNDQLF